VFVRKKTNGQGGTFYHIVHNVRRGATVRQVPILALGSHSDPREALRSWKRELTTLKRRAARPTGYKPTGKVEAVKLALVGRMIESLEGRIAILANLIKRGEISSE
jgi:hypothetical protein